MSDNHQGYEFPERVWEPTGNGWRSREPEQADRADRAERAEKIRRAAERKREE